MKGKRIVLAMASLSVAAVLCGCSLLEEQWTVAEKYRLENTTTEKKKKKEETTEIYKKQDTLEDFLNEDSMTLAGRIDTPNGYHRVGEKTTATQGKKKNASGTSKKKTASTSVKTSTNTSATTQSDDKRITRGTADTESNMDAEDGSTIMTTRLPESSVTKSAGADTTTQDITANRDNTSGQKKTIEEFMRNLDVKEAGQKVMLYNGKEKEKQDSYAAIINLKLDKGNFQQKASSIMRLYAEYFWTNRDYDAMQFHLINGFLADYPTWVSGKRFNVVSGTASWSGFEKREDNYDLLLSYLEKYFCYSGMDTLLSDSERQTSSKVAVGDFFVDMDKKNAAMIVDVAEDKKGKQCFLLASGGSPGQDIEILKNPLHEDPWYYVSELEGQFETPEFSLDSSLRWHLKNMAALGDRDSSQKADSTTESYGTTETGSTTETYRTTEMDSTTEAYRTTEMDSTTETYRTRETDSTTENDENMEESSELEER